MTPSSIQTENIAISADSSLAIIETNFLNNITILNMDTNTTEASFYFPEGVYSANFLNSSNNFVIVFGYWTTVIYDISLGIEYQIGFIPGTISVTDRLNNAFTCVDNTITQYNITVDIIEPEPEPVSIA